MRSNGLHFCFIDGKNTERFTVHTFADLLMKEDKLELVSKNVSEKKWKEKKSHHPISEQQHHSTGTALVYMKA